MTMKQKLGQFYTTNYEYILQNISIPKNVINIIEPFAGNGDLFNFCKKSNIDAKITCYDIEPKQKYILKKDTLLNPPNYDNNFICTNPPYLSRNKSKDKTLFNKYKQNDLYKCFLEILILSKCIGGILITPLNFWCSIRKNDINLRKRFLDKYRVLLINIFEEQVFDDTKYTICSFQFELKKTISDLKIKCIVYPDKKELHIRLDQTNNYMIGGHIYKLPQNKNINVIRATKCNKNNPGLTRILVKCIDNNIDNKICLSIVDAKDIYIDTTNKLSARSYATLIITPKITIKKQSKLVKKFNIYLNTQRELYKSLFLTNYRESNSIARKRISFKLVFRIVNYLLHE